MSVVDIFTRLMAAQLRQKADERTKLATRGISVIEKGGILSYESSPESVMQARIANTLRDLADDIEGAA